MAAAARRWDEDWRETLVGRKGAGWSRWRNQCRGPRTENGFGRWHPIAWTLDQRRTLKVSLALNTIPVSKEHSQVA